MARQQNSVRASDNPKRDPEPPSNTAKDPDDWVSGDDPMTGAQASYLKTLSEEAHEPSASTQISRRQRPRDASIVCGHN
jgi:hypothetical protein